MDKKMDELEKSIRNSAAWFVKGRYPEVLANNAVKVDDLAGKTVIVCIIACD